MPFLPHEGRIRGAIDVIGEPDQEIFPSWCKWQPHKMVSTSKFKAKFVLSGFYGGIQDGKFSAPKFIQAQQRDLDLE